MTDETIRSPRRLLPVLFLGVLMVALDIAIVGPSQPSIQRTFGVSERALTWILGIFVLFNLLGLPLMTKLADVFGRRTVYTIDVALFGAGSLGVALAPSFEVLLLGRCLQGLAASGIFPVASAVIGDTFPPERRGRVLGVLGAVYGLAFIIGPLIAGILLQLGWRWVFLVNLGLALVVGPLGIKILPVSRPDTSKLIDWFGIATLGVLLGALTYGINQINTEAFIESLTSFRVWPFFALALVLLPLFSRIEHRAPEPLLRPNLMRNRQVVLVCLFAAGAGIVEAAFIFFPAFSKVAFGVSDSVASFMLLPLAFAVAVGSPLAGRVLDRVGSRAVVLTGAASMAFGIGVIGLIPSTRLVFYLGTVAIGFGFAALLGSALSYILLNEARAEERTVAQGIITIFISVGQMIGLAFIGAVVASSQEPVAGYVRAYLIIGGIALTLTFLAFGLRERVSELETAREVASAGEASPDP